MYTLGLDSPPAGVPVMIASHPIPELVYNIIIIHVFTNRFVYCSDKSNEA